MTVHDIFYFRAYQDLAEKGECEGLLCNNDDSHGLLYANIQGNEDELFLYCLECNFKIIPGIVTIDLVKNIVREKIKND